MVIQEYAVVLAYSITCDGSHMFHSCLFQEPFMERLGVNSELYQFIVGLLTDKEVSVSIVFHLYLSMCVDVCRCVLKYGLIMPTCLLACSYLWPIESILYGQRYQDT